MNSYVHYTITIARIVMYTHSHKIRVFNLTATAVKKRLMAIIEYSFTLIKFFCLGLQVIAFREQVQVSFESCFAKVAGPARSSRRHKFLFVDLE
jgi:hypothetical protein